MKNISLKERMKGNIDNEDIKLQNCSIIKIVLMLCVVLGHCTNYWQGTWATFLEPPSIERIGLIWISRFLNSFHIYAFVLVSGYVYYAMKIEQKRYSDKQFFIHKKCKRLLVPYIVISVIWTMPITYYFYKLSIKDIIVKYGLGVNPSHLWFLLMLFWIYLMMCYLGERIHNSAFGSIMIVAVSYFIGSVGKHFLPDVYMVWTSFSFLPFFILGYKMRHYNLHILNKFPCILYFVVQVILLYLSYSITKEKLILKMVGIGLEFILHVNGAIMAFLLLQKFSDTLNHCFRDGERSRMICAFADYTMPIYLLHQPIIYFGLIWTEKIGDAYMRVLFIFVGTLVISILFSYAMKKYKIGRMMIGEE